MRLHTACLFLLATLAPPAQADGVATGTYAYDRHDTPIALHGKVAGRVADVVERDGERDVATLHLEAQDDDWTDLVGKWTPKSGGAPLPIRLRRQASMDRYDEH